MLHRPRLSYFGLTLDDAESCRQWEKREMPSSPVSPWLVRLPHAHRRKYRLSAFGGSLLGPAFVQSQFFDMQV